MIDYIIVGSGLAGISFAETALQNNKTIILFDNHSQNSSTVAGGMYNAVILKRYTKAWKASEQLQLLDSFYEAVENRIGTKVNIPIRIFRKIFSAEEQNDFIHASDKRDLEDFLSPEIVHKNYNGITAPFGFGEILKTGYVDTALLLKKYQSWLKENNFLQENSFQFSELQIFPDYVQYQNIQAKNIVFAEGFGVVNNPFFNNLPIVGTKGELLLVKIPNLNLDAVIKSSVFIMPLGNDLYKVGATYNWDDKTNEPTVEGKKELMESLKSIVSLDFEIVDHVAGIRPTTKDRKPLAGTHPKHANVHILNGLGTRGVMIGPHLALQLYNSIEKNIEIDIEANIKRFKKIIW
ncbi:FAD-dependent oxidoreductase [Flavobacterium sp. NST-5]|uniref:FAD-dependent oxidoreductase n=1 Tax=Flavobacterium ichthyis TaxID=2698827 RepID=A0ABW9Z7U5_9FLAO|nr:FAD-binding oxidoreductase [Flavobacterium ichthyis]NBL64771.1 FAD-dependent oxidoreductase [Flavobacterium ichthyis]